MNIEQMSKAQLTERVIALEKSLGLANAGIREKDADRAELKAKIDTLEKHIDQLEKSTAAVVEAREKEIHAYYAELKTQVEQVKREYMHVSTGILAFREMTREYKLLSEVKERSLATLLEQLEGVYFEKEEK